jgi:glycosyltransferase involved in cell wall biosynthesis
MKIVHICNNDLGGGAGIAAYRLHTALVEDGIDSKMYVLRKHSDDPNVIEASRGGRLRKRWSGRIEWMENKAVDSLILETDTLWSESLWPCFKVNEINRLQADVIHLHWINRGGLSIRELKKLNAKKIVWSLHDMWPFSGGFHYRGCYSEFPQESHKSRKRAKMITRIEKKKKSAWADIPFTWIPLSTWMERELKASNLHFDRPCKKVWNGVPLKTFKPIGRTQKETLKKSLSIQTSGPVFLFGAFSVNSDPRKGGDLLDVAISSLPRVSGEEDTVPWFVSFGGKKYHARTENGYVVHGLGLFQGDASLAQVYNCADLFICPSREDNLPNTCLEAIASGLPVLAFDIGGIPDIVIPNVSGCLVDPFDVDKFAEAIDGFISHPEMLPNLGERARELCVERFSPEQQVEEIREIYNS